MSNLAFLPVWKEGKSAEEFLNQVALFARDKPSHFNRVVVIFQAEHDDSGTVTNYYQHNADTTQVLGMMELAKHGLLNFTTERAC